MGRKSPAHTRRSGNARGTLRLRRRMGGCKFTPRSTATGLRCCSSRGSVMRSGPGNGSFQTGRSGSAASPSRTGAPGRSPKPPGPYTIEELADDAAEALAGTRAHVAGFSMGGYIAQTLAVRHPELVDRLVLICTATGGDELTPTPAETVAAWEANAGRPPEEFARATMPLSFRPGWTDDAPGRVRGAARRPARVPDAARVLERAVRGLPRVDGTRDTAGADRGPHARGARGCRPDPPVRERRRARRVGSPASRLERFEGAGHLLFLESPERFNPLVAGFLS